MRTFFIYLFLIVSSVGVSQEICNNAIDDDGDGLVDLNDEEDCNCPTSIPSGLIPNPSFEEMICCPTSPMQLDCAANWIQASEATSDYFHTCGLTGPWWVNKTAPQPLPDGDGYVGFRDGRATNGQFKEYVGACLNETMEIGKEYRLDFFLGFPPEIEQTIEMTIFGTTECSNIPFAPGNENIGCPTNVPGWTQIGQVTVTGQDEWKNIIYDIIADKPYSVMVIGPGCDIQDDLFNEWYFFVDRLALAELTDFEVPFATIEGTLCEDNLTIVAEDNVDYGYQWYKDGVAIIGETDIELQLAVDPANAGFYEVLISTPEGCFNSEEYELYIPVIETFLETTLCEGESITVGGTTLNTSGNYTIPLTSNIGCDSTVYVDLEVVQASSSFLEPYICQGEIFTVAGEALTETGVYTYTVTNALGCDSIISVDLSVSPIYDYILPISICDGNSYTQDGVILDQSGQYVFDYSSIAGCDSTVVIDLTVEPTYDIIEEVTICEGDTYQLGMQELSLPGTYSDNLTSSMGCDSSMTVILFVESASYSSITPTICSGETYPLLNEEYTTTGIYIDTTTNVVGCDSIITLDLTVVEWMDGITLPTDTTVDLGSSLALSPTFLDPLFNQIVWTDGMGEVLSNDLDLYIESVILPSTITAVVVDEFGCVDSDEIQIRVDRNVSIYTPNIFSPNADGSNEYFRPVVNESIASLKDMSIYDRWGNLVYSASDVIDLSSWLGWDGTFNSKDAAVAVYVYIAEFVALDGESEIVSGDITLIR